MADSVTREQVLGFRVRAQQLDAESTELAGASVLDLGAQDSGPDGAMWALAVRGVDVSTSDDDTLARVWTVRGAPHLYRRADLPSVAAAVEPFSDADAGKRIFDAARPLTAAGIGNLDALDAVASAMRSVVTAPMVKGEVSARLTAIMDQPYLRFCRPCQATHLYEQPFRLAALRAGLELEPGTSPPVLAPIAGFTRAPHASPQHDVVRAYLSLLGPATPKRVADYLDAPVRDVKARWPQDVVEVAVDGQVRWVLAADVDALGAPMPRVTRLLGPFDLFLQARDRPLLVADPLRAKALWPVLGRPGAVLHDGEIVATWRPRASGKRLRLQVDPWVAVTTKLRTAISAQAERLAAYRQVRLAGVDVGA